MNPETGREGAIEHCLFLFINATGAPVARLPGGGWQLFFKVWGP